MRAVISIEAAKLAKELGIQIPSIYEYDDNLRLKRISTSIDTNIGPYEEYLVSVKDNHYTAIEIAAIQDYLRDEYGIQIYAFSSTPDTLHGGYKDYVVHMNNKCLNDARDEEYPTYESAMRYGVEVALRTIMAVCTTPVNK